MIEYEITSDLIESDEPMTFAAIAEFISSEWTYDGWKLETGVSGDEVRVYAYRDGSEENQPSRYTNWTMVTRDYGYIVIAIEIEYVTVNEFATREGIHPETLRRLLRNPARREQVLPGAYHTNPDNRGRGEWRIPASCMYTRTYVQR